MHYYNAETQNFSFSELKKILFDKECIVSCTSNQHRTSHILLCELILTLKTLNAYWLSILSSYELFRTNVNVASYWLRDIFYRLYENKNKQKVNANTQLCII